MDTHGRKSVFAEYLSRWTPYSLVMNLSLPDESQGDMSQLDQVATGSDAPVFGNERNDVAIDEFRQKFDHFGMNSGASLQQRSQTRDHGRLDIQVGQWLSCTRRMTPNDVILKIFQIAVVDTPLGHWTKTGVDAIDDLFRGETL